MLFTGLILCIQIRSYSASFFSTFCCVLSLRLALIFSTLNIKRCNVTPLSHRVRYHSRRELSESQRLPNHFALVSVIILLIVLVFVTVLISVLLNVVIDNLRILQKVYVPVYTDQYRGAA